MLASRTRLRSTAQGVMFHIGRGGWSLLLPTVQDAGFPVLALVLAFLLVTSGAAGIVFAPNTRERDLEHTRRASLR